MEIILELRLRRVDVPSAAAMNAAQPTEFVRAHNLDKIIAGAATPPAVPIDRDPVLMGNAIPCYDLHDEVKMMNAGELVGPLIKRIVDFATGWLELTLRKGNESCVTALNADEVIMQVNDHVADETLKGLNGIAEIIKPVGTPEDVINIDAHEIATFAKMQVYRSLMEQNPEWASLLS